MKQLASLYRAVDIRQIPPPLIIGERSNPTGSKKFRDLLTANDYEGCLQIGVDQEKIGAHVVDLSVAWAGRNEENDLLRLVQMYARTLQVPLMIDSTSAKAIELALAAYPGRPIVNSINLEDGGKNLDTVCRLVKKYGACVTALTIDEKGMAMDAERKFAVAKRIYRLVVDKYGISADSLFFDPLTFTVGSGDENLEDAAIQTLEAIKLIKSQLPDCHTILGLSNISFGLPLPARRVLNAIFLHEATSVGLDAVIIDPTNCVSLESIDEEAARLGFDLLYNRSVSGEKPLMRYIRYFEDHSQNEVRKEEDNTPCEQMIRDRIMAGNQQDLEDILRMLLDRYSALEIVNLHLVTAMREVGVLFGSGDMLLPFVLQSAEVMRKAVEYLEPFMDKNDRNTAPTVLLATVQGDVHDIGKNLVNIILSNNGYNVIDLGIKVSAEKIIETVEENSDIDIICLSGLLVKSAMIMQESMAKYKKAGLDIPILLGGAALTRKFVACDCVPQYDGPVVYCRDAFSGLKAIQDFEQGSLVSTTWENNTGVNGSSGQKKKSEIMVLDSIPSPPFTGRRISTAPVSDFLDLINLQILFRGRWGYRRGKMSDPEYQEMLDTTIMPEYEEIKNKFLSQDILKPQICYGWYPCERLNDELVIYDEGNRHHFPLPRQRHEPGLSLVDYFRTKDQGADLVGLFVVSLGEEPARICKQLYDADKYHEYLLVHGFCVEAAEALAQHTHNEMRRQLNIKNRGQRYSFGYSACPDLDLQKPLFSILKPEDIGVTLSSSMEMVPELSVSAILLHHPEAHYFSV